MSQAIALLKTAVALLILLQSATNIPTALRDQANVVVSEAIRSANQAIVGAQTTSAPTTASSGQGGVQSPQDVSTSVVSSAPAQASTPTVPASIPTSQARIEIVNYPTDLTRQYSAMPASCKLVIGSNYNDVDCSPNAYPNNGDVTLKAVLYHDDGSVNQTGVMQISATDARQNKTFNGTGDIVTFYKGDQKQQVYGYVFGYHFLVSGDHTITFSANGLSKSVTLMAQ